MSEFNNRIIIQRDIIKILNKGKFAHQITGLSRSAIERWIIENKLDSNSDLIDLLLELSGKLFFLANKSQEQITDSYKKASGDISRLLQELKEMIL
ncbi:MAG: hypothetical protein Roseis2KO_26710 [Roseivirga sp.]